MLQTTPGLVNLVILHKHTLETDSFYMRLPPLRKLLIHAYIRIHTRASHHHYLALGVDDPLPRPFRHSAMLM